MPSLETLDTLQTFESWAKHRHDYARDWKARTGREVVGYFCTYMPEEIIYAAGLLPVRILGSHEPQDITEPHIFGMFCPFCRDCLAQGLKGRYDYLGGLTIAQSCLHIRNTYGSWLIHKPTAYSYYLPMPNHLQSRAAKKYLRAEFVAFKLSLENWTGRAITDDDLWQAIEVYNRSRRQMRQVYETRKVDNPPISGLEAIQMVVSGQLTDKAEHNLALAQALEMLPSRQRGQPAARLMLIGSENDDTEFIRMVESTGAGIVVDDHCTGSRYFWNEVATEGDPLTALANRYVDRVPCPSKDYPQRRRFDHILRLIKDYRVGGVILIQQKFCDPHELDIPPLNWLLTKNDIPTLFLELDVTVPIGPFRTRVEAFLETMAEEDLF